MEANATGSRRMRPLSSLASKWLGLGMLAVTRMACGGASRLNIGVVALTVYVSHAMFRGHDSSLFTKKGHPR